MSYSMTMEQLLVLVENMIDSRERAVGGTEKDAFESYYDECQIENATGIDVMCSMRRELNNPRCLGCSEICHDLVDGYCEGCNAEHGWSPCDDCNHDYDEDACDKCPI